MKIPKGIHDKIVGSIRYPYYLYLDAWFGVTSRYPLGTNIYERDWDVLLVLDTARPDAIEHVADEYDFISEPIETIWSTGSGSAEWIANTFTEKYIKDIRKTAYISTNGFTDMVLSRGEMPSEKGWLDLASWDTVREEDFDILHYMKNDCPDIKFHRYMPPEPINDRSIAAWRGADVQKMVVHYQQPHDPYALKAIEEDRELTEYEKRPLRQLAQGKVSRSKVWNDYIEELRYGLDGIENLLDSIDAEKVVITADHGEALGEFGVHRHPLGIPIPQLREVPWIETTANRVNEREHTYAFDQTGKLDTAEIKEQLADLGYR